LTLEGSSKSVEVTDTDAEIISNLSKWEKILFGDKGASPQVNFNGDIARFVAVR
jgi:hypothetical protein